MGVSPHALLLAQIRELEKRLSCCFRNGLSFLANCNRKLAAGQSIYVSLTTLHTSQALNSRTALDMLLPMLGLTALPYVGALYGSYITRKEVKTWYPTLQKPSWRPPNAAFAVVWTGLYTGMGYGSYLVWRELGGFTEDALVPMGLYALQLALNWAWTPLFFGAHKLKLALMEIVVLTGTVGATMVSWYPISRTAGLLMVPYLAWLCVATSLNYCIWRDNPEKKEE